MTNSRSIDPLKAFFVVTPKDHGVICGKKPRADAFFVLTGKKWPGGGNTFLTKMEYILIQTLLITCTQFYKIASVFEDLSNPFCESSEKKPALPKE